MELAIDRDAAVVRTELDARSWVDLCTGFVPNADEQFRAIHGGTAWLQNEVLRYDRYVPEQRLGAGLRADADPLLRQAGMHLQSRYGVPFTGVGALLYRNGDDFQGLHSDREMRWLDDTRVAIVVLGARRPFVIRGRGSRADAIERVPAGSAAGDVVLRPGKGDLLVMGGACQRDWLHGVPKSPGTGAGRISLTWRWTSRRGRPDTNPTYYDGRHYADMPRKQSTRLRKA
ncbi:MAG TPA: alpha-ketoglutarate-dependent dioxygenase AlkB [Acidimicrobiia bacterium]